MDAIVAFPHNYGCSQLGEDHENTKKILRDMVLHPNAGADSKTASYRLETGYDNMHRIVSKKQHLTQQGVQFDGTLHVGYDLAVSGG